MNTLMNVLAHSWDDAWLTVCFAVAFTVSYALFSLISEWWANRPKHKRCPFCKSKVGTPCDDQGRTFIFCTECSAQGPAFNNEGIDEPETHKKAIDAWNKRKWL